MAERGEFASKSLAPLFAIVIWAGMAQIRKRDKLIAGVIMLARIYKPAKTAMQSGRAKTKEWVLEYEPATPREIDPLMGWTSSNDMLSQVRLFFETKEEAIDYAQKNGIPFRVFEPHPRAFIKKSYADNFKFGRIGSWTH